jgi:hypothetical protein
MLEQTNTSPQRVAIGYRRIDELALDPKNPRLHSPRQVSQIARSTLGFETPADRLQAVLH